MSDVILAVDQSTSATKAILFEPSGDVIDKTSVGHEQHYPRPGWVEHDAEEIYRNTIGVIKAVVEKNPGAAISHLSITNQRETFVVFEKGTGRPLHRAIVWQCRRGDPICKELVAAGHEERVKRATGLPIDTYFPASKLKWLLDGNEGVRKALDDGSALFGTIDTYLIYRLTGGEVFASDHSNASRTLFLDVGALDWSDELCGIFGVPRGALPEVRESSARFGETDCGGALPKPVPICGVMGDSQASLFAQRCYTPGSAKVTFGTGSSCLLNIGHDFRLAGGGLVTALAWVLGGKPTYAFEGIINFAGATVAWLKDQLRLIDDPKETEPLATAVEDNGGVYLVPAFVGLSAPYWDQSAKAAIVGLTPHSTKEHVVRAALESIAYQVREVFDAMSADAGVPIEGVNADGGMVANRFLVQFVADIAGIEVRASEVPDLSALGAVLAGELGMGMCASLDEIERLPRSFTKFTPTMSPDRVSANFDGWKKAVRRVL